MEATGFANLTNKHKICGFCKNYFLKIFPLKAGEKISNQTTLTELNKEFKLKAFIGQICPNCMGICQLVNSQSFLAYLHESVKEAGFEFEGFNFNFRLPLSQKLRQRYFQSILTKEISENKLEHPAEVFDFDLKSTIKNCLNLEMSAMSGVEASSSEDFVISLEFANPDDELEFVG